MAGVPSTPNAYDGPDEQIDDQQDEQSELEDEMPQHVKGGLEEGDEAPGNGRPYPMAEAPTDYSLFSNPPQLGLMRQRLFDIEDTIEMPAADFEAYFPFVDNVWRRLRASEPQKDTGITTEVYWCRLRKGTSHKPHTPKPTPEGKQTRKKRVRDEKTCGMALKVVYSDGPVKTCVVSRSVSKDEKHTHDLDYVDSSKRNSGVMDIARREAIRGFLPKSVFDKMWEEPENMHHAGGKFMKVSDVRNVQYAWRQENPDFPLKAHSGFSQARAPRQRHSLPRVLPPQPLPTAPAPLPPPQPPVPLRHQPSNALQYPEHARVFLQPYMPNHGAVIARRKPHITLTWASSLDSRIALMPGVQTKISGPETKAMTHYLRSRHDAIVVGVRTAIADDPSLNCRIAGVGGYGGIGFEGQPRPIIIDPHARLQIRPEMKILKNAAEGRARAPWVVVNPGVNLHPVAVGTLKAHGGEYLMIHDYHPESGLNWESLFDVLFREGIRSVMIEGGGVVLSELLKPRYAHIIDSVIVTIAPTFFGKQGVQVSPDPAVDMHGKPVATRLKDVRWQPMGDEDVVMCSHMKWEESQAPTNGILSGIEEFSHAGPPAAGGRGSF